MIIVELPGAPRHTRISMSDKTVMIEYAEGRGEQAFWRCVSTLRVSNGIDFPVTSGSNPTNRELLFIRQLYKDHFES